jgi:hypothetical protein
MATASQRVEVLLQQIASLAPIQIGEIHTLSVPGALTIKDQPVQHDVAMAVLLHALLAKGLYPDGFSETPRGREYRYRYEGK